MASVNLSDGDTIKVNVSSEETLNTNLQDINYIPGYIAAEEERRTNEASRISNESTRIANEDTRIENEIAREEYIADLKQRVENGEFNGDIVDVKVDGTSVTENGIAYVDLSGKVDKETGKGLSTNDYTTIEKNKLGDLANVKSIGSGLSLDSDGELSNTQTSANWGNITGTLSEQTDLQEALNGKANSTHTHTTTDITDFPTVPSDLSDLTDETNILAGKQNTLTAGDNITIENNVISSTGGIPDYDSLPVGTILPYSSSTVPVGYLLCDGSLISRTEYSGLFNVIGTTYNLETDTDDTKFRLPDYRDRVPVGLDSEDTDFSTIGKTGGEKTHKLTFNELPLNSFNASGSSGDWTYVGLSSAKSHNNLQPYIVTNYIIKASGTAVLKGNVVNNLTDNSTENAPSQYAVNEEFTKVKGKILWTNPKPTDSINTLSMTLENSDYDELEIVYILSTTAQYMSTKKVLKGFTTRLDFPTTTNIVFRNLTYVSDTSFTLTAIGSTAGEGNTNQIIPLYVIGYKTGLFG